ncbi:hypothetical protein L6164_029294 [Bauhinia variegata]|uniref:Uncharacterized protein n=1 Tax=Bauhinia variegata TaxID=167791 RepID=A0ACB9L8M8_BAUVA|nr:hypothetical protein L6164_029294 [Bauhinia variegata]
MLQEPESSTCLLSDMSNEEDNGGETKFQELSPISFNTPDLIPMMHSAQERIYFPSPASADDQILNSSSIQSFGTTYINLDLTI